MAKKRVPRKTKPAAPEAGPVPIKAPVIRPIQPTVAQSARDPYADAQSRMAALPTVGESLTAEKVQGLFAHMFFLSPSELNAMLKRSGVTVLELQIVRLLLRSMRELPNEYFDELDKDGKPVIGDDGKVKKTNRIKSLHKDTLQNEKQALDATKYLQERAFGKPKITVEHTGVGGAPIQLQAEAVLTAMDNLPKNVIDIIAKSTTVKRGK